MPWRLITFLVVLTIVVLFAGFNIKNVTDISFGFYTLSKVPVFLGLFISFLVGTFVMLPFAVRGRKTKGTPQKSRDSRQNAEPQPLAAVPVEETQLPEAETSKKKRARKK